MSFPTSFEASPPPVVDRALFEIQYDSSNSSLWAKMLSIMNARKNPSHEAEEVCSTTDPKRIKIISNNPAFLAEKWKVIAEYTQKVDPFVKLEEMKIEEVKNKKLNKRGFTHQIYIGNILPRLVSTLYGSNILNNLVGNCFGASLMVAGVIPFMTSGYPGILGISSGKMKEITSVKDLQTGDLITSTSKDHAFVFLDHDLSVSMDGRGQSLELGHTENILEKYEFGKDLLKDNSETNEMSQKNITILRKNKDWHVPEKLLSIAMNFYNYYNSHYGHISVEDYPEAKKEVMQIVQEIDQHVQKILDGSITKEEKEVLVLWYHSLQRSIPRDFITESKFYKEFNS